MRVTFLALTHLCVFVQSLKYHKREVAWFLIKKPEVDTNLVNIAGWTPFLLAVVDGDVTIVKYLHEERGAEDKVKTVEGEVALHRAIQHRNNEVAAYLVGDLKHEVDPVDNFGWSPLHYSVLVGNVEGFDYLISKGADSLKVTDDGVDVVDINERSKHTKEPTKKIFREKFEGLFSKKPAELKAEAEAAKVEEGQKTHEKSEL